MNDIMQLMKISKKGGADGGGGGKKGGAGQKKASADLSSFGLDNLDKDQMKLIICNLLQKLQD